MNKRALVLTVAAGVGLVAVGRAALGDGVAGRAGEAGPAGAPANATATAPAAPSAAPSAAALRFVVAPAGNEVRYRVREQLVGFDLPNDAVGKSAAVSGGIAFDAAGGVLPVESKFTVDASTFVSDKERRDGYVRGRLLTTDQYPTIQLVPTAVRGLSLPLPTSGTKTFSLVGNLTVRGVTRPTVWNVTAKFDQGRITGSANTGFTFADFNLQQPRVPVVLSVADSIHLEYDFALAQENAAQP